MSQPVSTIRYAVDRNHAGVRGATLLTMLVSALLSIFVIVPAVASILRLSSALQTVAYLIITAALTVGATWAVERLLTAKWPSGRWIAVEDEGVSLLQKSSRMQLRWAEPVRITTWYFEIRNGRAWVPKGWYCTACQLSQNERSITAYAFMRPTQSNLLAGWSSFEQLLPKATGRQPEHMDGQQGLRQAESERWENGVEMQSDDFRSFVALVREKLSPRGQ